MGRPKVYTDETVVCLRPNGESTLKKFSDRRAIVNAIIDMGGKATISQINNHFGFDFTEKIMALVHAGWLEVSE